MTKWITGEWTAKRCDMLASKLRLITKTCIVLLIALLAMSSTPDETSVDATDILERLFVLEELMEIGSSPIDPYIYRVKYDAAPYPISFPPFDTNVLTTAANECWHISIALGMLASAKSNSRITRDVYAYPDLVVAQVPEAAVYDIAQSYLAVTCTSLNRGRSQLGIGNINYGVSPDSAMHIDIYDRAGSFLATASSALSSTVHILGDNPAEYGLHGRNYSLSSLSKENRDLLVTALWTRADSEMNWIADLFEQIPITCQDSSCMATMMQTAADTCDIANNYIGKIAFLSDEPDWSQVQVHMIHYCDGLDGVVELLNANQVRAAGPALDTALASLALALPYIERLLGGE
ncbi:MAG: hypothetical protein OXG64_07210 [Chloroflexi bacterium]|nr:hypothetical protein [Chloroflexota bacterium]